MKQAGSSFGFICSDVLLSCFLVALVFASLSTHGDIWFLAMVSGLGIFSGAELEVDSLSGACRRRASADSAVELEVGSSCGARRRRVSADGFPLPFLLLIVAWTI